MPKKLKAVISSILAICILAVPGQGRSQNRDTAGDKAIELSLLTKGKKVIPLVFEYPSLPITDIKLPDLVISNCLAEPVTPVELEVICTAKGKRIATFLLGGDRAVRLIDQANPQFKRVLASADGRDGLAYGLGEVSVDAASLSEGATIGPGQSAVLLLSRVLHIHLAGNDRLDGLKIIVTVKGGKNEHSVPLSLPLHFHESKIQYIFPVRGNVAIANMPMNYLHHRQAHSQEFALDITAEAPNASGQLTSSRKENSSELSDYYIYRRELLAAADGTVVEVANSFPEEECVSPAGWTEAASAAVIEQLAGRIGFKNAASGNSITIQHAAHEFSFYGHLSQDSIRVTPGNRVKAGQVIALVGSTGNSSEPHLHFQVMDSREFTTANGLPVKFADVPPTAMNQYFRGANSLATSDYLHTFLPAVTEADGKEPAVGPEAAACRGE